MIDIRAFNSERDLERAKLCVPEGGAEPNWPACIVVERDGEIIGVGGIQVRHVLEPAFFKKKDPVAYLMLVSHLDGILRASGIKQYEFFVADEAKEHQKFLEESLNVEEGRESKPGKFYFRKVE